MLTLHESELRPTRAKAVWVLGRYKECIEAAGLCLVGPISLKQSYIS